MNFEKLNALMEAQPARGIPFSHVIVTKDGETVFEKSVGFADAEGKVPYTNNHLCWIFSCTKVITCVAAMRLVEEGRLQLSDPVSKYLPAYAYLTVKDKNGKVIPAKNTMTVFHLFTMTGGLNYEKNTAPIIREIQNPTANTVSLCNAIAQSPLDFEPGTNFKYSLCHDCCLIALTCQNTDAMLTDSAVLVRYIIGNTLGVTFHVSMHMIMFGYVMGIRFRKGTVCIFSYPIPFTCHAFHCRRLSNELSIANHLRRNPSADRRTGMLQIVSVKTVRNKSRILHGRQLYGIPIRFRLRQVLLILMNGITA